METVKTRQYLSFYLGTEIYGIQLEGCKEVDHNKRILKVPHAPSYIEGIVNLRGDLVTILNLSSLFGKPQTISNQKYSLIRLKGKKETFAILSDSVSDIIEVSDNALEACPSHLSEKESRFIRCVSVLENGTLIILNQEELLRLEDE
ncbi:chemotaxis protein CheW [Leptospira wolffii]|uniref:Chemotaxis protein CheW n=1 Tax=Leptospira wolffii TaxID=409998 RepID=A0A2M9ZBZ2_9LEPT|nr:chemotaxis protein CheW [Leptospira wolffii]PJZ65943.1 chemotaxis protein CheW [Leptospira wolffii]TGK59337.1 chemotaxis protein CheW [Leptospira wolffii]TGK71280.1 chemotaxis protein CheW [Leptospira wolffii]TGK77847.1 chemotaxis protein CheW [Leptospira wolffii]TGL29443.1 chemotaxis protein CheW [Leptospira wolffii]